MAKRSSLQEQLDRLGTFKTDPTTAEATAALKHALATGDGPLVDKAARVMGTAAAPFTADLADAFARLVSKGMAADKGCLAKKAIATVLYEAGADTPEVFLVGVRYVQQEPVWGGQTDTAAELRGVCAMGLVRIGHRGVMLELADLLADPEMQARIAAARALAYAGHDTGALLLRLKLLIGDAEESVTSECLAALARIPVPHALPFVGQFLESMLSVMRDAAAMALGESRRPEAFDILRNYVHQQGVGLDRDARRIAFVAMAALRSTEAMDFLLSRVADASVAEAIDAIDALGALRRDSSVSSRLTAIVEARGDSSLSNAVRRILSD